MPLRQPDNQLTLTGKSPSQTDQDCISSLLSEALLRVDIPTREEVRSIDESSQIYQDEHALVMTERVISKGETTRARLVDMTFILADDKLITLRYGDPTPFRAFVVRAEKS
jgi:magnesium transporter